LVKNQLLRRRQPMNGKDLLRKIGGFVLAALLLSGVAIMSTTSVQAQGFHGGGGVRGGGGFHGGGFHGGGFHGGGLRDGGGFRDGDRFRDDRFRDGGFHTRVFIGPGYGYYGYPYGYSSQYVFGSVGVAESQGYQDGFATGSNDARRRQSYNPDRSHYFQDAGFGNFSEAYREGFTRGYNDGFSR
jgi:hypothetical protein